MYTVDDIGRDRHRNRELLEKLTKKAEKDAKTLVEKLKKRGFQVELTADNTVIFGLQNELRTVTVQVRPSLRRKRTLYYEKDGLDYHEVYLGPFLWFFDLLLDNFLENRFP